jgi:hypothetical protein
VVPLKTVMLPSGVLLSPLLAPGATGPTVLPFGPMTVIDIWSAPSYQPVNRR